METILKDEAVEKQEAIDAGQRALTSLRTAESNLTSASNWGVWDMLGGGFFSTMLKHDKMEIAEENIEKAQKDLIRFRSELSDVHLECATTLSSDDFLTFADFAFDGFFVDCMMQERIEEALSRVKDAIRRVQQALSYLY